MFRMRGWLNRFKEYARDYALENTSLKLLALLITALLWLSVASRPVTEVILSDVPIVFNVPNSSDVGVSKWDTLTARVALSGPRDVVSTLRGTDLSVIADLSGVQPGVRVIQLQLDRGQLPTSVKERSIEPRRIRVTIERLVEREVPVKPRLEGQAPEGYEVVSTVSPEKIKIKGLPKDVNGVTEISTESVNIGGRLGTFSHEVAIDIEPPNISVAPDQPDKVQLRYTIAEQLVERVVTAIPIKLVDAPEGLKVIPRFINVTLRGPRSMVQLLSPSDVIATVSYGQSELPHDRKPIRIAPAVTVSGYEGKIAVLRVDPDKVTIR